MVLSANDRADIANCSDFLIKKEDHTIGNLLSEYLKKHKRVLMAGYKGMYCSSRPDHHSHTHTH